MNEKLGDLRSAWTRFQYSRWRRVAQILFVGSSLGLMLHALGSSLSNFDLSLQLDVLSLLFGLVFMMIAFWMGTLAWAAILRAINPDLPFLLSIKYHLLSTLAKYLPGCGWQQVSKVFQLYRRGVPPSLAMLPVTLELTLTVLTGLTVATLTLYLSKTTLFGFELSNGIMIAVVTALWVACATVPFVVGTIVQGISSKGGKVLLSLWLAEGLDMIGSLALGLSLWFLARALTPISLDALPYCIIAVNVSFIAGLVIIFAPNGWGVRELTMSTLLQSILPVPLSITCAVIARLVVIAAEFLCVIPLISINPHKPKN